MTFVKNWDDANTLACVSFIYAFPRGEAPIYRNSFYFIDQMRKTNNDDDDDGDDDDGDDDEFGLWAKTSDKDMKRTYIRTYKQPYVWFCTYVSMYALCSSVFPW